MNLQQYTPRQELANTLTHGIGIVLCIVAIPVLMAMAVKQDLSTRSMVGLSVYAVSLLLVYTTSTLYHAITSLRLKRIFKILDHICIYLLIGGSNTAFIPRFVDEKHATLVLATQWTLIAAGIVFKLYFTGKYKWLSTFFYIGLAGLVFFVINELIANVPPNAMTLVAACGAFYVVGCFFYLNKTIYYQHAIWHIFVLLGSAAHYAALLISL
ncbi:MAG: hypothetical protein RI894_2405 [Bacteroidota bacterium]|jgi:hemolysin III